MKNPKLFQSRAVESSAYTGGAYLGERQSSDITLRDLFAGMAMQGFLSEIGPVYHAREKPLEAYASVAATFAYSVADAMLKERDRAEGA